MTLSCRGKENNVATRTWLQIEDDLKLHNPETGLEVTMPQCVKGLDLQETPSR